MSAGTLNGSTQRRANGRGHVAECVCPLCGSELDPVSYQAILGRQRVVAEQIEKAAEAKFAKQLAEVERKRKREIDAAVKAATAVLRDGQADIVAKAVEVEREKSGKAVVEAVASLRLEYAGEKARLEAALSDVQRKLAAKTAFQIGEKPEADLAESMSQLCAGDRVTRTPRGVKGGDVLIEVLSGDDQTVAGKILLDSKAVSKWQSSLSRKLALDKAAIEADFGLLVSNTLPAGEQQTGICIRDGIICCTVERAPVLVTLLRNIIIDNHVLKLSVQERDTKADKLFNFLVSGAGNGLLDRLLRLSRDLETLGIAEERAHKLTFSKRADLIRGLVEVHGTFTETIAEVIGGGR